MNDYKYRLLDHTADLAMEVTSQSLDSIYKDAGLALFDLIFSCTTPVSKNVLDITVEGQDREDLLVNWLRELLYLWTGKGMLTHAIKINGVDETHLSASVTVDHFSESRHDILNEIKAVTYHGISVKKIPEGWRAVVVLDI